LQRKNKNTEEQFNINESAENHNAKGLHQNLIFMVRLSTYSGLIFYKLNLIQGNLSDIPLTVYMRINLTGIILGQIDFLI
jgi:hypothetical protein